LESFHFLEIRSIRSPHAAVRHSKPYLPTKMGAYLSEPITKKEISVDEDENFTVASASMQGWRVSQEVIFNVFSPVYLPNFQHY